MLFTQHGSDEVSIQVRDSNTLVVSALRCVSGCQVAESDSSASTKANSSWVGPIAASLAISLTSFVGVIILGLNKKRINAVVST